MSLRILEALFLQTAHTLKCQTWQFNVPVIILLWEKMAFLILPHALCMQTIASVLLFPSREGARQVWCGVFLFDCFVLLCFWENTIRHFLCFFRYHCFSSDEQPSSPTSFSHFCCGLHCLGNPLLIQCWGMEERLLFTDGQSRKTNHSGIKTTFSFLIILRFEQLVLQHDLLPFVFQKVSTWVQSKTILSSSRSPNYQVSVEKKVLSKSIFCLVVCHVNTSCRRRCRSKQTRNSFALRYCVTTDSSFRLSHLSFSPHTWEIPVG